MRESVEFKNAENYDALDLATTIRDADRIEIETSHRMKAADAIIKSIEVSEEATTVLVDGRVMGIFGVVPFQAELAGMPLRSKKLRVGEAWLVTSVEVDRHPKLFWRLSKHALSMLMERWDVLFNAIDERYEKALRWGRHLGFDFGDPVEMVPGFQFIPVKVEPSWVQQAQSK